MNAKSIKALVIGLLIASLGATGALAASGKPRDDNRHYSPVRDKIVSFFRDLREKKEKPRFEWKRPEHGNTDPRGVPELDGAGAGIALGLLASLVALRRERRRIKGKQDS
ncbi:MAG: hypothetical protein HRT77_08610 [Halioglobus sp.]|nr:hypothetical protein [Halioglobus sp.]